MQLLICALLCAALGVQGQIPEYWLKWVATKDPYYVRNPVEWLDKFPDTYEGAEKQYFGNDLVSRGLDEKQRETDEEKTPLVHFESLGVRGAELAECSRPGMAMAGFNGYCAPGGGFGGEGFNGTLHLCINLTSQFCEAVQSTNFIMAEYKCHDGPRFDEQGQMRLCPIQNWCVDEWKFATYVQMHGCSVTIRCEATSMAARVHYMLYGKNTPGVKEAVSCINDQCGTEDLEDELLEFKKFYAEEERKYYEEGMMNKRRYRRTSKERGRASYRRYRERHMTNAYATGKTPASAFSRQQMPSVRVTGLAPRSVAAASSSIPVVASRNLQRFSPSALLVFETYPNLFRFVAVALFGASAACGTAYTMLQLCPVMLDSTKKPLLS